MNSQLGFGNHSSSAYTQGPSQLSPEFLSMITSNTRSISSSQQRLEMEDESNGPSMSHIYAVLARCWRYERGSTLLLPYPGDFLSPVKDYIDHIEGLLLDKRITNELQASLHELEIERLRFILNDLHRTRLRKIELHALFYAYDSNGKKDLSPSELEFAKGYAKLLMGTMKEGFGDLPGQLGRESVMFESPPRDHIALLHYLPKELSENRTLEIPNQTRPLYSNTVIIAPYRECEEWIKNGDFDVL